MEKTSVHHIQGRLRIRNPKLKQAPAITHAIVTVLSQKDGVYRTSTNARTGSILIEYDARRIQASTLLKAIEEAGLKLYLCDIREPITKSASHAWLHTTMSIIWSRLIHELVNAALSATILPKAPSGSVKQLQPKYRASSTIRKK